MWSTLSYFSTIMSGLMILNGIWRLVYAPQPLTSTPHFRFKFHQCARYYRLYLKIKIDASPTDLSQDVFKFASIEEGESPLGR